MPMVGQLIIQEILKAEQVFNMIMDLLKIRRNELSGKYKIKQ